MPLLNRAEQRSKIAMPNTPSVRAIEQEYNEPAKLQFSSGEWTPTACLRCTHPQCMKYVDDEISCEEFSDFSYERNLKVCPVDAISWDFQTELPQIDNTACIQCGLCALRCPAGAIFKKRGRMCISEPDDHYTDLPIDHPNLEAHKKLIRELEHIAWNHHFQRESDAILDQIYHKISRFDGRSMVPNVLVRNLMISLHHRCAISRAGDVYTRMDAVYESKIPPMCQGAMEIEFGRDTLEASRGILDDIAVLHSRGNLDKMNNTALVVCLSFPNRRQGYFQVIKDVNNVLGIKIQTISLGALLTLAWSGVPINFFAKEFYVDFDNMSIRQIMEFRLGRQVNLSEGWLGILEPEK